MKENSIRRAVREGRAALGTGLKEFATRGRYLQEARQARQRSAETEAQIEEYWKFGCKVLNLPGTDTSTYRDGLKACAERAHARLKSIGVPTP